MTTQPLDSDDGPTVYITDEIYGDDAYRLLVGIDPDNPLKTVAVSKRELEAALSFVDGDGQ